MLCADHPGLLGGERGILCQVWIQEGGTRDGALLRTVREACRRKVTKEIGEHCVSRDSTPASVEETGLHWWRYRQELC